MLLTSVVAAVGWVDFFGNSPAVLTENNRLHIETPATKKQTLVEMIQSQLSAQENEKPAETPWPERFQQLTLQMGQLTDSPEDIDRELTRVAEDLSTSQLQELQTIAISSHSSGDEKLLAVELLNRSPNEASLPLLKSVVMTDPQEVFKNPLLQQEFRAIQMSAIEGLALKPADQSQADATLQELASSTSDSALADRLQRALWARQGKAPSPPEQDRVALEQLLQHR
jgi:hypothetical protein